MSRYRGKNRCNQCHLTYFIDEVLGNDRGVCPICILKNGGYKPYKCEKCKRIYWLKPTDLNTGLCTHHTQIKAEKKYLDLKELKGRR